MVNKATETLAALGHLILVAVLLAALGGPAFAQEDDERARIAELERALDAVEARVQAGEDLKARIADLEKQLAELEAATESEGEGEAATGAADQLVPAGVQGAPNPLRDETHYLTGEDLLDASFPNSIPIPGSPVRVRISGYAKLDFIHDIDYVGDRFEFELATIPVDGTPEAALEGRTTGHAKESRVSVDFRSKAPWGSSGAEFPMQAFLEIDFFDDREAFALQPRLRQAFGVVGRLLAGRTWNISSDLQALPGTIDFSGGDAPYGGRVAQLRWQDRLGDRVVWALGLEDPKTSIGNPLGVEGVDRPRLPNFAGKVRLTSQGGSHVQFGGDLFMLDWQGGNAGPSDREIGFGINLTGRWLLGGSSTNAFVGGGSIGRGSAHRVIVLSWDGGNDAVITPEGLKVVSHWQAYGGFSRYWTESLNSTISAAWTWLDNAASHPDDAVHRARSAYLNLIWFPHKLVSTGGEIMWGERVNKDGAKGQAWRLQYMVKFKFN